jgi:hypothetical protein
MLIGRGQERVSEDVIGAVAVKLGLGFLILFRRIYGELRRERGQDDLWI